MRFQTSLTSINKLRGNGTSMATLQDVLKTPLDRVLLTEPCSPGTQHPLYGPWCDATVASSPNKDSSISPALEFPQVGSSPLQEDIEQEFLSCLKRSSTDISALENLVIRVDLSAENGFGRFEPLHLAASQGRMEAVKFLVERKGWEVDRLNSEMEVGKFCIPRTNGVSCTERNRHH